MKSTLIIAILISFSVSYGRGLNPSSQDFGGISVPDPNSNINKKSPSRKDIEKARELMAQFGYGQTTSEPKNEDSSATTSGKK